ncbi:hypothetical protein C2S51_033974 [Perilla frutescens var. frutescens]|nr:hypothetical protein C2S51_033974 [Perilla frutescens var. frutescens]
MSQISSESDLDLDIDLESGGTTSEEDASKNQAFSCVNSKKLLGRVRSGLTRSKSLGECTSDEDCSCSYDEFMTSDEILAKNKEQLGRFAQFGHKKIDEEKPKKPNSTKPPRPPRGPSLDASDMKLLKEITELKSKRRRMERSGTSKKMKKEKASSQKTNLLACLVTVVFVLVIIFEGISGNGDWLIYLVQKALVHTLYGTPIATAAGMNFCIIGHLSYENKNTVKQEKSNECPTLYIYSPTFISYPFQAYWWRSVLLLRPSGFTNVMPHQLSSFRGSLLVIGVF